MKNLLTLIFSISVLTASAQYTASINKAKSNNLCIERGHSLTFTKAIPAKAPYTIDTKDSTVTVYPVPTTTGKCARCGADVESSEKELRVTTWRRVEQPIQPTNLSSPVTENINWGLNNQRAIDKGFHFSNLNDIKKVATLKNLDICPIRSLSKSVLMLPSLFVSQSFLFEKNHWNFYGKSIHWTS